MTKQLAVVAVTLMAMSDLSKLIGRIGKASATLSNQIQAAAAQCIGYSVRDRNATPAMQLFDALSAGHRRDALVAHFEKFGNLTWSKAEKRVIFIDMEKAFGRKLEWTEEYAKQVQEASWLKAKAEPQPKSVFDVDEETAKFLERAVRAKGKVKDFKGAPLLERLMETYHKYVAEQYEAKGTGIPTAEDVVETAKTDRPKADQMNKLIEKFGGKPVALPEKQAA